MPWSLFGTVLQSNILLALAAIALGWLFCSPAQAVCTRWQVQAIWSDDQDEHNHNGFGHNGFGHNKPSALSDARAKCVKTTVTDAEKTKCRSTTPTREKYLCTDGQCIHVDIENDLGWRRDQGWSREAFCIDRGFDGVIHDKTDDQGGVCFKGEC